MNTMTTDTTLSGGLDARVLRGGYGESAWHGPELKGALADVTSATAFWRPAPGRPHIAEIGLPPPSCGRGAPERRRDPAPPRLLRSRRPREAGRCGPRAVRPRGRRLVHAGGSIRIVLVERCGGAPSRTDTT